MFISFVRKVIAKQIVYRHSLLIIVDTFQEMATLSEIMLSEPYFPLDLQYMNWGLYIPGLNSLNPIFFKISTKLLTQLIFTVIILC